METLTYTDKNNELRNFEIKSSVKLTNTMTLPPRSITGTLHYDVGWIIRHYDYRGIPLFEKLNVEDLITGKKILTQSTGGRSRRRRNKRRTRRLR
jgi:hypothetical protein